MRTESNITAASYPELISSEFSVLSCRPGVWTMEDAATNARWSRYRFAGAAIALAMMVILPVLSRGSVDVPGETVEQAASAPVCARWNDIAKAALIAAIRDGRDRGLSQTGDPLAPLRRARHDCRMTRLAIACLEFNAVAQASARPQSAGADAPVACDAIESSDGRRIAGLLERK